MYDKIFVLTDNKKQYDAFQELLDQFNVKKNFAFYCSPGNKLLNDEIRSINLKEKHVWVSNHYQLAFSLHSKQLFPEPLVETIPCINIHPGYNPYNRGWYPQVFAILEDNVIGATIHLMDKELDNGQIIARKKVEKHCWDTSETLYKRVLEAEFELLNESLENILNGTFKSFPPEEKGELKLKKDFYQHCEIDLDKEGTFRDFYNYLRSMSHGDFKNAYFVDTTTGKKVYLKLKIELENE
ncbi:MAG: dTDP-4-amino-4,6-dideoxyglucose formyltransferase [bacterium]